MIYDITRVIEEYPEIHIGVLIGQGMDNKRQIPELYQLQKEAIKHAQRQIGAQPPTSHPHIASWRQLYRSFGTKPGDYRPSSEALIRRCTKTGKLPRINNVVDLYNIVSVRHIIPMGGFDIDTIDSNIYLRFSPGGEPFIPLGSGDPEQTYPGEVVYADESHILTRRWNYRDANHTKITKETRNLAMFIDATPEIPPVRVWKALDTLKMYYEKHCGGEYSTTIADKENPLIDLRD
jgi:DNA/RNA-binding domain of Phe-tRNA-synthetase-like protein